ncbi:MAG: methyltransferase domain-containing protein [Terriglobia bacterium]
MIRLSEVIQGPATVTEKNLQKRLSAFRPQPHWSDLWKAPFHDFPVRVEILCQYLTLTPGMDVLEIGPGSGYTAFWLARQVRHLTLLDASNQALAEVRRLLTNNPNISYLEWDLSQPGLADKLGRTFDAVYGLDVFEYVSNPKTSLLNLAEVLLPGGELLLTFPNSPPPIGDAVTYFSHPGDIELLLEEAGFQEWKIFTISLRPWAGALHRALHDRPLEYYRSLRKTNGVGLPQIYEQTWAFQNRRGLHRLKVPLNLYWALLRKILLLRGDVFAEEPNGGELLGRRLVIWAQK